MFRILKIECIRQIASCFFNIYKSYTYIFQQTYSPFRCWLFNPSCKQEVTHRYPVMCIKGHDAVQVSKSLTAVIISTARIPFRTLATDVNVMKIGKEMYPSFLQGVPFYFHPLFSLQLVVIHLDVAFTAKRQRRAGFFPSFRRLAFCLCSNLSSRLKWTPHAFSVTMHLRLQQKGRGQWVEPLTLPVF